MTDCKNSIEYVHVNKVIIEIPEYMLLVRWLRTHQHSVNYPGWDASKESASGWSRTRICATKSKEKSVARTQSHDLFYIDTRSNVPHPRYTRLPFSSTQCIFYYVPEKLVVDGIRALVEPSQERFQLSRRVIIHGHDYLFRHRGRYLYVPIRFSILLKWTDVSMYTTDPCTTADKL